MEQNNENETIEYGSSAPVVVEKKDRFLSISILVAAVVIGGAVLFATLYKPAAQAPANPSLANAGAVAPQPMVAPAATLALGPRDAILGDANAPVTIIEYGDYQCPFCSRYFSQIQPQIISNFINTGKAKMVFRDFPFLGPESTAAGNAAQCAQDQNKLWAYHDALYVAKVQDEAKGGGEGDGFYNRALFLKLAQQTGLAIPTFTSCIDSNKNASLVQAEVTNATAAGVNSTPVTFVNGVEVTAVQNGQNLSAGADAATVLAAIQKAVAGK